MTDHDDRIEREAEEYMSGGPRRGWEPCETCSRCVTGSLFDVRSPNVLAYLDGECGICTDHPEVPIVVMLDARRPCWRGEDDA